MAVLTRLVLKPLTATASLDPAPHPDRKTTVAMDKFREIFLAKKRR